MLSKKRLRMKPDLADKLLFLRENSKRYTDPKESKTTGKRDEDESDHANMLQDLWECVAGDDDDDDILEDETEEMQAMETK
ncbi:hypothetical protein HOLleu_29025 [Holothuria leucospilota]|uniref:Uncharacterized protein n=1 Tax=Holothuria leucospilota TaxID=206669 RepID=A0A9Q1BN41_HOLLE|nr:hypothetical protein HOLleu_29025 [Holothuria leucospilota]